MNNHLREIKGPQGDPVIRGKALRVLGLPEDATPEEITMAFLARPDDDPVHDHHMLTPEIRQLFKDWREYRKQVKGVLAGEKKPVPPAPIKAEGSKAEEKKAA